MRIADPGSHEFGDQNEIDLTEIIDLDDEDAETELPYGRERFN